MTPNSRSYINHFTQPDTIVPNPYNSQDWDRYAYARNNPLKYTDPSGHDPISIFLLIAATAFFISSCTTPQDQIQSAINQAQTSGKPEDYQAAINLTVDKYNIDTTNMNGGIPIYNPNLAPSGKTNEIGMVEIGPNAFNGAPVLVDTIAHESIHTLQLLEGRFYIDDVGKRINELEAYDYILNNTEKFDLTDPYYLPLLESDKKVRDRIMDEIKKLTSPFEYETIEKSVRNGNYIYPNGTVVIQ